MLSHFADGNTELLCQAILELGPEAGLPKFVASWVPHRRREFLETPSLSCSALWKKMFQDCSVCFGTVLCIL